MVTLDALEPHPKIHTQMQSVDTVTGWISVAAAFANTVGVIYVICAAYPYPCRSHRASFAYYKLILFLDVSGSHAAE